ncbi:type II secretion system protein [Ruminococcus albus]|uniref:Prepilin-type N-terminal cleavage/methylation domain-containing protein n=1 Tax=Ruminococcus albus TaxID=1264 RepID=A0A1H7J372_RUMAL|nr:type II secretion system protein [Ruminococcus albus]SEK69201.1 prepilin-type N-terminal cleavage/methylation domain-containing protein [Ruminococcus albus]
MKKNNNINSPNRKGFTLVELITVISIVAVMAAMIVPNLLKLIEKANNTRDANEAKDLGKLIMSMAALDDDLNLYNPWSTNLDPDGTSSWGYIYVGKDDVRTSSKQMMQMLIDNGYVKEDAAIRRRGGDVPGEGEQQVYKKDTTLMCHSNHNWVAYEIHFRIMPDGNLDISYCATKASTNNLADADADEKATKLFCKFAAGHTDEFAIEHANHNY